MSSEEQLAAQVEAQQQLESFVSSTTEKRVIRESQSMQALRTTRNEHSDKIKKNTVKSDLKRSTAFIKKIKSNLTVSSLPIIVSDIETLNLTRHTGEVAQALFDAKIKPVDSNAAVTVIIEMNKRYKDFLPTIMQMYAAILKNEKDSKKEKSSSSSAPVDPKEKARMRRMGIRILAELAISAGAGTNDEYAPLEKMLLKFVSDATGAPSKTNTDPNENYNVQDVNVLLSFARVAGPDLIRVIPRNITELIPLSGKSPSILLPILDISDSSAITKNLAVKDEVSKCLNTHVKGSFKQLSASFIATHKRLVTLERRCAKDRLVVGENLGEKREKGLKDARALFDNLKKSVETLANSLDVDVPVMAEVEQEEEEEEKGGLEIWTKVEGSDEELGPFDDEETRAFYSDVPDLLLKIPHVLLGLEEEEVEQLKALNKRKYGFDEEIGGDDTDGVQDTDGEIAEPLNDSSAEDTTTDKDDENTSETKGGEENKNNNSNNNDEENIAEDESNDKETPHYKLMQLLESSLPNCTCREQADELAETFCASFAQIKNSRKRLAKALNALPRTRLDLISHYSRFLATVDRVLKDVAPIVLSELQDEFRYGLRHGVKKNIFEMRSKNARYIAELTKFRVAPPIIVFRCLEGCFENFVGPNIEIACTLIECCGRFLFRMKHTQAKTKAKLEKMVRLKKSKNLEPRFNSLIDNAMFNVNPPVAAKKTIKVLEPHEAYTKYLILALLDASTCTDVCLQLRRLPWSSDPDKYTKLIIKYMVKACYKGRHSTLPAIAKLCLKLRIYRPCVSISLLDTLLEVLQQGIENPNFRDQQRMLGFARCLAELYNRKLMTDEVLFNLLYTLVQLGHEVPENLREESDKIYSALPPPPRMADENENATMDEKGVTDGDQNSGANGENDSSNGENGDTPTQKAPPAPVPVSPYSEYDPRVFCPKDPPNSVFRIKLVCVLLSAAGKRLCRGDTVGRLRRYLPFFHRYLFTKPVLPADVEFAALDLFDLLDSSYKSAGMGARRKLNSRPFERPSSWMEAHLTVVELEKAEHERRMNSEEKKKLAAEEFAEEEEVEEAEEEEFSEEEEIEQDDDEQDDEDGDGDDDDDDGQDQEDDSSDSSSCSDDDSDSTGSSDSSDFEEPTEEEELAARAAHMKKLEEEAFERELRKMTMDALEKGKTQANSVGGSRKMADNMIHAKNIVGNKTTEGNKATDDDATTSTLSGTTGVAFRLIKMGHKGRVESKQIVVPEKSTLAKTASKTDDAGLREKEAIKARVLQYSVESDRAGYMGGNVYMEQDRLKANRNKTLTMGEIDKQFGNNTREVSAGRGGGGPGRGGPGRGGGSRTLFQA